MSTTNQATGLKVFNSQITNPKTQEYLAQVLGEKKSSFVNNLTALVANNSMLQQCEPMTVMYASLKATALDLPLDPNLGFAYVIPYRNNRSGVTDAQFQIGSKGFIQLAMRSGQFKTINVRDVREGEIVDEDFISGELKFQRLKDNREQAPVIGYVSFFRLTNGFEKSLYMTVAEINMHASKYSKTYNSNNSVWKTEFDAMAEKTVLKRLLSKYAPMSIEMQNAVKFDQGVIRGENEIEYVDNDSNNSIPIVAEEVTEEDMQRYFDEAKQNPAKAAEYLAQGKITNEMFDKIIEGGK